MDSLKEDVKVSSKSIFHLIPRMAVYLKPISAYHIYWVAVEEFILTYHNKEI